VNRFLLPAAVFLVLAGVLYVGVQHSPNKSTLTSALLGKPAPEFTLPTLAGGQISSKDLLGKPWVMNVWGTWCFACREEHPVLLDIAKRDEVVLIGLNWRDDDAAAREWLVRLGDPYRVTAVDNEGRTAIEFGVYGAPETFFIDSAGFVQYRHVGPMTLEIWQKEFVARLPPPLQQGGMP
jgi:cytochrome c biogenesis protein CcmG, thiol:disulfide interchange protein DsbE